MLYGVLYYFVFGMYYSWKYKTELTIIRRIAERYLNTPRLTYQLRSILRRHIMVIHNFV